MIVALIAAVATLTAARFSGGIHAFEMRLYDWRVRSQVKDAENPDVIIVGIDNETLADPGLTLWGPAALAREHYAAMVEHLSNAGVSVIGLDVAMVREADEDEALAEALRQAGNVVVIADAVAEVGRRGRREHYTFIDPALDVASAARLTASPLMARPDNVVRFFHSWQATEDGKRLFPALATAIAQVHSPELARHTPDIETVMRRPDAQVQWIRWVGQSPAFDVLSARHVVKGEFDADRVRGKIALVGRWDTMEDTLQTPLGPMPGVEIHAHAVVTALGGLWLLRSAIVDALIAVLLALVLAWGGARLSTGHTVLLTSALIGLVVVAALVAFRAANVWIEIVPAALALAVVGFFVGLRQTEVALSVVGRLMPDWVSTEPEELTGTLLVCDIRGYTTRSETEQADQVMQALEDFFAAVDRAMAPHKAIAARRPGDAAIILFRDEKGQSPHADRALRAALDLRATLAGLATEFAAKGREPLETGTTLVTGTITLGWLGTSPPEAQIIGDPLNVAFRLQEFARDRHHDLLISGETVAALSEEVPLEHIGATHVRGRERKIELFTVTDLDERPLSQ